jgi:hypothetical protein
MTPEPAHAEEVAATKWVRNQNPDATFDVTKEVLQHQPAPTPRASWWPPPAGRRSPVGTTGTTAP